MKSLPLAAALGLLAAAASSVTAHEYKLGALVIGHPYIIEGAPTAKTAAGYLSIENTGSAPDTLVAVRSDFAPASLHTTELGADGVARMHALAGLDLPAGATVTFEPKGLHVMFVGLTAPLKDGDSVPATLIFQKAGEIAVDFHVQPRTAGSMGDMGHMAPAN